MLKTVYNIALSEFHRNSTVDNTKRSELLFGKMVLSDFIRTTCLVAIQFEFILCHLGLHI